LFYVACTRAVDELHIRSAFNAPKKDKKPEHLAYELSDYFASHHQENATESDNITLYELGELTLKTESEKLSSNLDIHLFGETLWFPEISLIDRDALDDLSLDQNRVVGRVVHAVLENMHSSADLTEALDKEVKKQAISHELRNWVAAHLQKLLEHSEVLDLIFPKLDEQTLDEREILISASERIRPDRVIIGQNEVRVIDYKTGLPRKRDVKQIQEYAYALMAMGYQNCKAYLVYTDEIKVQQVI